MTENENEPVLPRAWGWAGLAALALGVACLWWLAWFGAKTQFLPPGGAPWIAYPSPPDPSMKRAIALPATFETQFVLKQQRMAWLEWRAFQRCEVTINGARVEAPDPGNWKKWRGTNVLDFVRAGTNEIIATVWAATGPPALSLRLRTENGTMATDERWEASLAGGVRLPAILAGTAVEPLAGNALAGAETMAAAWKEGWWLELCFGVVAVALAWGLRKRASRGVLLGAGAAAWIILLTHNIYWLRIPTGFDARPHLAYVDYLRQNGRLPPPEEGSEMWQPPMYYALAAAALHWARGATESAAALMILRGLNVVFGAANAALVYLGLGFLYPGQWRRQLAGAALAGFTPGVLYLLHYPTNEILAGTLGTACLVLGLKATAATRWRTGWLAALGATFGAACLAKASALTLAPILVAVLAADLWRRGERAPWRWMATAGLVFGAAAVVGGWHYWRLLRLGVNPLVGDWYGNRSPGWQEPGWATASYYLGFGRCLASPYFSGLRGFWDGLYATLWGDGLMGGRVAVSQRPPWNYGLMTMGYALALGPSLLLLTGVIARAAAWARRPTLPWLWLGGTAGIYILALAAMTLRAPSYAHAKAFFALAALLPFCAFVVEGFEFWARRSRAAAVLGMICAVWFVNNYAAFWIRPRGMQTRLLPAIAAFYDPANPNPPGWALAALEEAAQKAGTGRPMAVEALMSAELRAGATNRAAALALGAARDGSANGWILSQADAALTGAGQWDAALGLTERAAHDAPDDAGIARTWLELARAARRDGLTAEAGAWLFRDDPADAPGHAVVAEALTRLGRTNEAGLHRDLAGARVR